MMSKLDLGGTIQAVGGDAIKKVGGMAAELGIVDEKALEEMQKSILFFKNYLS